MSKKKFSTYLRECKRCNNLFRSEFKEYFCQNCNKNLNGSRKISKGPTKTKETNLIFQIYRLKSRS